MPSHHSVEHRLLALILALYVALGFTYALVTPAFEASDELWHYPMVRHLADGNPLPVQVFDPALAGPWNQEASQPPLYYYLGAALTFWIDQSDMDTARRLNPHVDNGILTADGNTNLAVHDPRADPWSGALLAVRVVRLFSVLLGAATVYLTYRIAAETAPNRPEIALGAAAINAFLPMFLFISGAVNNDNLALPLTSLALLLMIRIVRRRQIVYSPVRWWEWIVLGLIIGLAALTKEGTLGLIPMAFGTAVVAAWQRLVGEQENRGRGVPSRSPALSSAVAGLVAAVVLMLIPALLVAGWWYYRNIVLYGDWLGWSAFIAVLGQRGHDASLAQLWGERRGFMMSFWGLFGGVNVPMSFWIYTVLSSVLVLSVAGFMLHLVRVIRVEFGKWRTGQGPWFGRLLRIVERHFGLIVNLIFSAAVVYGLIQWATTTWSSQGRLVFTAISSLATLMALGLAAVGDWVAGLSRWRKPVSAYLLGGVAVLLFAVAAAAPWLWIRPAYQPPPASQPPAERLDVVFGDRMRLAGYDVEYDSPRPGSSVRVRLEWEVLQAMDRDWSVFIHLNDPVLGRPIAQRDMYPGAGLEPTSFLLPGQRLVDEYVLTIPTTAIAPADLEVVVGLYDYHTEERLRTTDGREAVLLSLLPLAAEEGPVPNPVSFFFEHGLELVGFAVEPRRVPAGDTVELITYWRPSQPLPDNLAFFAQIVGGDTTRYAAADTPPQPTETWGIGEVVELPFTLAVDLAAPPDAYPLIVGVYTRTADGGFDRLQQVVPDGRLTDDFLTLTLVKVDAP
ncbi:MAG: glycosyltransferase family 39 protein [Candidatus Promineofilum sp.]|nr:glycosyltransferase family 39 protein [Promineifilum sp.]